MARPKRGVYVAARRPQAANPELPMEQLMWLLELTLGGASEEDEAQPGQPQQPPGGADGAGDEAHRGGAPGGSGGGEGPSFPMLRRGPRPAHHPDALEPSPGAFAPAAVQQAAGGGGSDSADAAAGEEEDQEEVHVALETLLPGGTE